jgi:hypothetical protein
MVEDKTYRDAIQQISGVPNAKSQRTQILRLLIDARGGWVPLPKLLACAAQYNARVLELRRLGFVIENKTERVHGVRHSWFRLVSWPTPEPKSEPAKAKAAIPDSSDWYERQHGPRPSAPDPDAFRLTPPEPRP